MLNLKVFQRVFLFLLEVTRLCMRGLSKILLGAFKLNRRIDASRVSFPFFFSISSLCEQCLRLGVLCLAFYENE